MALHGVVCAVCRHEFMDETPNVSLGLCLALLVRLLFPLARPKRPRPLLSFNECDVSNENGITVDEFVSRKLHSYSHGTQAGTEVSPRNT